MKQRVMRVGNSLGVTIPADFVNAIGVKPGDLVEVIKIVEQNKIIYRFSGVQQLPITANFLKRTGTFGVKKQTPKVKKIKKQV